MVIHNVTRRLQQRRPAVGDDGAVAGRRRRRCAPTATSSTSIVRSASTDDDDRPSTGPAARSARARSTRSSAGSSSSQRPLEHLDPRRRRPTPTSHAIDLDAQQVTVVDLHNLNDRAKRFVVGVTLRQAFENKEATGTARAAAVRRARRAQQVRARARARARSRRSCSTSPSAAAASASILVGAQQTASEVERRVIANSAMRVVGRLDPAEASRPEYGFLPRGAPPAGHDRSSRARCSCPSREIPCRCVRRVPVPGVGDPPGRGRSADRPGAAAGPAAASTTRSTGCAEREAPAHLRLARRQDDPRRVAGPTSTAPCSPRSPTSPTAEDGRPDPRGRRPVRVGRADARGRGSRLPGAARPARHRRRRWS